VGFFSSLFTSKAKDSVKPIDIKDRFDLENPIGQGSMSKVYRARDKRIGRTVCVKVLDKLKTKRFEERFRGLKRPNEGVVSVSLRHKNIVRTFEWGLTNKGEIFLVMEMIDGVGLNFLIETRNKQLEGNRFNYLQQIADGLQYIHDQGYLHRDICPRNTMINTEGVVKLIDFGLTIPDTEEFRRPGNRTGTANYMAPELIKRVSTDRRVDLFALGVTAFETFTGNLPWEGAQSLQTMLSHLNAQARDPREFYPDMPPELYKFIMKAVERDPRDRFQTAKEFREACRRLAEKFPL
jgi:eukaryotic-like serine/threonine-protein kinase